MNTSTSDAAKTSIFKKLCCVSCIPARYPSAFWVCLCFVALGLWMKEVGYSPLFMPENLSQETLAALRDTKYFFYGGAIAASFICVIFGNRLDSLFKKNFFTLPILLGSTMCLSTFSLLMSFSQALVDPIFLLNISSFISAACYSFFLLVLVVKLAENEGMKTSIICLTVASLAEMIVESLLNAALTNIALIVVTILLPLLCSFVLAFIVEKISKREETRSLLTGRERSYHIALTYVMSFGSVAVISAELSGPKLVLFGTRGDWLASSAFSLIVLIVVALMLALLAWFFLVRRLDDPISTRFQPSLLIVVIGCLLLVMNSFVENQLVFSLEVIVARFISPFAWLLSWSIAVSVINSTSVSPSRLLGFRGLLFNLLVILKIILLERNSLVVNALILLSVFVIICGLTIFSAKLNQPIRVNDERLLQEIASKHKLSAREIEVFVLLAQGRNGPNIEKQLVIARGTVKTHANRIYSKMGVHSRQELLDLVAEERKIRQI